MRRDRERLAAVRASAPPAAQAYFRLMRSEWDRIRKLHVTDEACFEAEMAAALAGAPFAPCSISALGNRRMLELFGPQIERGLGLDLSLDMLGDGARATRSRRPAY